jgi:hypothetical protein
MSSEKTLTIIKGSLRSLAASVPFAGSLAQAWSEYDGYLKDARTEAFFSELQITIAAFADRIQKVETHIRESGEFPTLLERTVECVQREPSAEKRKLFAIALLHCIADGSKLDTAEKLDVLETLDRLSLQDIRILRQVAGERRVQISELCSGAIGDWAEKMIEPQIGLFAVVFGKLESRGLVGESVPKNIDLVSMIHEDHWTNRWRRRTFELLPYGKRFLEHVPSNA